MPGTASDRPRASVRARRPPVPRIADVFHAHFTGHAYPADTHGTWDLVILDDGSVDFALGRRHGAAVGATVLLLLPGVPLTAGPSRRPGSAGASLYLDDSVLPRRLTGRAVDAPVLGDGLPRRRIEQLHTALARAGEELHHTRAVPAPALRFRGGRLNLRQPSSGSSRSEMELMQYRWSVGVG
ncbi:AraC family ligand binding domain-containing protein [Streptomyces sp. F63]|uniref:AraC family ligand binding domain-containing protein n=1 Tax=Streptomyces sp. F63 TaxID=2824887 RepID=UPI001B383274|nr:AraC family ligand binding domain-containing protein [Streptomyces sp. F63]MBQ0986782.1 AraC family ligand binding domain-containing protein [Streptomyces sp. F63]